MDGTRCVGVDIEREGRPVSVDARAVVLCDGGFQSNHALLREFIYPHPEKLKQRNAGAGNGDALQMARAVGAQLVGMEKFYGHMLAQEAMHGDGLWPYPDGRSPVLGGHHRRRDGPQSRWTRAWAACTW